MVYATMREMKRQVEDVIDSVKVRMGNGEVMNLCLVLIN